MLDLLVHASSYGPPTNGMRYAAQLAKLLNASLTGIFVSEPVVPLGSMGASPVIPELYAAVAQVIQQAREAEPTFNRWAGEQGVSRHRWQVATGFFSAALAAAANWHDALVLESGKQSAWSSVGTLGHALVTCGIPGFVVPDTYGKAASLQTIVVASHGSAEAVRALHAALPILARAKRIVLAKGRPAEAFSSVDFHPAFSVEAHLQSHGLAYETRLLDAHDERVGAEILDATEEAAADLLVMGAYGRTRFSEWVLGGATRHVLEHTRVPLFMRH
jgi:nucleotide-binding universal stress UspA family protein